MPYLLGWSVIPQILVRRERWPGGYKMRGTALVYAGQEVQCDQPVIRLHKAEAVQTVDTAPRMVLPSVKLADRADRDAANGEAQPGNERPGETVPAGLNGRVVDITRRGGVVIESRVAAVEGVIGAGSQVAGVLTMWQPGSGAISPGAILVVPGTTKFCDAAAVHEFKHSRYRRQQHCLA